MIFALIPAGGQSRRMGRPKLALPLGGRTVLEHVINALHQAGVGHVLVVVGPHVPELVPLAHQARAAAYILPRETADMRATVEQGLSWIEQRWDRRPDDPWLLVPADHPTLDAGVVRLLLTAYEPSSGQTIVIPTHEGKRGHPSLLAWKHVAGIRALPPDVGINVYLRQQGAAVRELPVASADILTDLDTPADYERLRERWDG